MSKSPAETVDRLRKQAWGRTCEPEHTMMLEAAGVIAGLMGAVGFARRNAEQIKARSQVSTPDDEKELRRQMAHIASLADDIRANS